jgi:hypothetical protein
MDVVRLFEDFSIPYYTEGYKYCRPGWINIDCPFCEANHPGPHLGFNTNDDHFHCWSCGWHSNLDVFTKVLNLNWYQARDVVKQYGGRTFVLYEEKEQKYNTRPHRLPSNTTPLQRNHKKYLESRGFDPDYLEREWGLVGTGPVSLLGDLNYKHRIIIPYIWNGRQVSFDARDITGKAGNKYQACPIEREIIPHKDILYGKQSAWKETGLAVEGPSDVWRLGPLSFATSGISFTPKQITCIAKAFKRVIILYDEKEEKEPSFFSKKAIEHNRNIPQERQAAEQAKKLIAELRFRGTDAFRVKIKGDPGAMEQSEANYLVKQLI